MGIILCVGKSFFDFLMYVELCCSGYCEGVQRKRGASCLEVLQGDLRRLCHRAFKAQVRVLQFLVALGCDSKLGLTVVLVFSP